jgi:hypothetical protein
MPASSPLGIFIELRSVTGNYRVYSFYDVWHYWNPLLRECCGVIKIEPWWLFVLKPLGLLTPPSGNSVNRRGRILGNDFDGGWGGRCWRHPNPLRPPAVMSFTLGWFQYRTWPIFRTYFHEPSLKFLSSYLVFPEGLPTLCALLRT